MLDTSTPILVTQAIMLGCLFLGLIMQVIHAQSIHKTEKRINEKLDQLLEADTMEIEYHGSPATLEDLIQRDLTQHAGSTMAPMSDEDFDKLMKDMRND
jgi:hypothetical protein